MATRTKDRPKIKVGTILERAVYLRLKERAAREGRSISDMLGTAIERFTQPQAGDVEERLKAFDAMTPEAMLDLLERLSRCENPFGCPHGRPSFLKYTFFDLEKQFKRK